MTNKMKWISVALATVLPIMAFAETDPIASEILQDIRNGRNNLNQIETLRVKTGIVYKGTTITPSAAELNILAGVTATAAELNIMDNVTSTAAELNGADVSASSNNAAPGFLYSLKCGKTFTAASPLYTNSTLGITIPDNAIIVGGVLDITVAMISTSNDGTLALNVMAANDILYAVDADTLGATHTNAVLPYLGTPSSWLKMTNSLPVTLTTATHVVTNGTFNLTLFYIMGR